MEPARGRKGGTHLTKRHRMGQKNLLLWPGVLGSVEKEVREVKAIEGLRLVTRLESS